MIYLIVHGPGSHRSAVAYAREVGHPSRKVVSTRRAAMLIEGTTGRRLEWFGPWDDSGDKERLDEQVLSRGCVWVDR